MLRGLAVVVAAAMLAAGATPTRGDVGGGVVVELLVFALGLAGAWTAARR